MEYGYSKKVAMSFDEAVEKVTGELKNEGFGILTEIDVKETLKQKLDVDFKPYVILGACNPSLAHKALQTEKEIGLLMPCNVIVYEKDNKEVVVSAIEVDSMLSVVENPEIGDFAQQVKQKLHKAINAV